MAEKLYRSRKSKVLGGVCGGIAEYFNIDPAIVRILWILLCIFSAGLGIIAYLICWLIVPLEPEEAVDVSAREVKDTQGTKMESEGEVKEAQDTKRESKEGKKGDGGLLVIGSFFVCLGFLWIIGERFYIHSVGGMAAILVGLTIVIYWAVERR
ncbi:MAG: PspC domain-containing protein [Candidatus Thermoplasmatota archaeon]|nr:PspC domain-containing protein [Candidatus Thermoplasmatota archaeon]